MSNDRRKKQISILSETVEDSSLREMVDLVIESLNNQETEDPIESYSNHLRSHFYSNRDKFEHRFIKGYEVLLEVLKPKHSNEQNYS